MWNTNRNLLPRWTNTLAAAHSYTPLPLKWCGGGEDSAPAVVFLFVSVRSATVIGAGETGY